jgi:hypothetical protein
MMILKTMGSLMESSLRVNDLRIAVSYFAAAVSIF